VKAFSGLPDVRQDWFLRGLVLLRDEKPLCSAEHQGREVLVLARNKGLVKTSEMARKATRGFQRVILLKYKSG